MFEQEWPRTECKRTGVFYRQFVVAQTIEYRQIREW